MRDKLPNSMVAEMIAMVNALFDGLKHKLIMPGDEVLIQSDCMAAIEILQRTSFVTVADQYRHVHKVFHDLCKSGEVAVRFRHVKGHTTHAEPRYAANRACDMRAKTAMRARRLLEQG